jgi:hypothetical protein
MRYSATLAEFAPIQEAPQIIMNKNHLTRRDAFSARRPAGADTRVGSDGCDEG